MVRINGVAAPAGVAQPNQSLMRGVSCLQAVFSAEGPVGSREVARLLGEEHTRVCRLLGTLAQVGVVEKTNSRKYRPGPAVHVLAAQSMRSSGLLSAAMRHLPPLLSEKLIVALGVLWNRHVCYLLYVRPGQRLEEGLADHQLYPAELSSIGLALLAQRGWNEVRGAVAGGGIPRDSRKQAWLRGYLARTRRRGYALLHDEPGQFTLAVPVGNPPVAALAFAGPVGRHPVASLVRKLKDAAARIGSDLRA